MLLRPGLETIRGATRPLTLGLMATAGVLAWFGVSTILGYKEAAEAQALAVRVEQMRGQLVQLDEVLTMSLRMAVVTGEPRWSERYAQYEALLERALTDAAPIAARTCRRAAVDSARRARDDRLRIERAALAQVRKGDLGGGLEILGSDVYERRRREFASSIRRFALSDRRALRLEQLRAELMNIDEVLTMSARIGAATGNATWEIRYNMFERSLDAALSEAKSLAGPTPGAGTRLTSEANAELVAMERQAFVLVRSGVPSQARQLLDGSRYTAAKRQYALGMTQLADELRRESRQMLSQQRRLAWLKSIGPLLLAVLLLAAWAVVIVAVRRSEAKLVATTQELTAQTAELDESLRELRTTQAQLVQSGKLAGLGTLAAGVAHEINNPLTGVLGIAEALQMRIEKGLDPGDLKRDLQTITRAGERCRDIVAKLLAFARQSTGILEWVSVRAAVEQPLALLAADLRRRQVRVVVDVSDDLRAWTNGTELEQIVMNLAANAAEETRAGGEVMVRARAEGPGGVVLQVVDQGPGIAAEHIEHIFEPFFTTKPVGQGTGLGLSVVHGLVKQHGGRIDVDSGPAGSTFTIHFAAGPEEPPASDDVHPEGVGVAVAPGHGHRNIKRG